MKKKKKSGRKTPQTKSKKAKGGAAKGGSKLKKKGVHAATALAGVALGYTLGPKAFLPGGVGAYFAKAPWQENVAIGAMGGAVIAGTFSQKPIEPSETPLKDYQQDVMHRGKSLVKGLARGLFVDEIAPEQFDKLDQALGCIESPMEDVDFEAAQEFIHQLEMAESSKTVDGIAAYLPEPTTRSMSGLSRYTGIPEAA